MAMENNLKNQPQPDPNEGFFKALARAYAAAEGNALREEQADLESSHRLPPGTGLDKKIKRKQAAGRFRSYALRTLPLAASLIIAVWVYNGYVATKTPYSSGPSAGASSADSSSAAADSAPDTETELLRSGVAFVSVSLPAGYQVTGIDYDNRQAVLDIENIENNRIVLTLTAGGVLENEGYTAVSLNGGTAYGMVRNDYSVLTYHKDGMLYTLTSPYGCEDLIEISKNIL